MGSVELALMVSVWSTLAWIGMDMYLPALPLLDETFGSSEALVNATLFTYQVCIALGSLVGGPISDKVGRRVPLIVGAVLYLASTFACAVSVNVWMLLIARVLAGFGGGVVSAVVMAVVKDELEGEQLDRVVTVSQALIVIGPIAAPFLGSLAIGIVGWRGIFFVLAALALACTLWILPLEETLPEERRADVSIVLSLSLVFRLLKKLPFTLLLLVLAAPAFAFGAFMTLCSYIYLDGFGLSYASYSACYAVTTVVSVAGPFAYLWLKNRIGNRWVAVLIPSILVCAGAGILLIGSLSPMVFLVFCMPFAFAESMARPCAYLVLLRAEPDNAGSASALVGFALGALCALGTPAASLPWGSHLTGMGWITLLGGLVALAILAILLVGMKSNILEDARDDAASSSAGRRNGE